MKMDVGNIFAHALERVWEPLEDLFLIALPSVVDRFLSGYVERIGGGYDDTLQRMLLCRQPWEFAFTLRFHVKPHGRCIVTTTGHFLVTFETCSPHQSPLEPQLLVTCKDVAGSMRPPLSRLECTEHTSSRYKTSLGKVRHFQEFKVCKCFHGSSLTFRNCKK